MPSVGRFLELLEAVSRRDSASVAAITRTVADEERKLRHYSAAHALLNAAEVAVSTSGYDREALLARAGSAPPLDILQRVDVEQVEAPVLSEDLDQEVANFIGEWRSESKLRAAGVCPRQTVLLHGPPGCGKTLVARHLAFVLKLPLFLVRFDALISSYLGETASNLQKIFAYIASNRCALLIDEIDAIAKLRDDRNELGELKRVVISLLQNLDHTANNSLLLATTNHPHLLDPALWRRFEVVWEVDLPEASARRKILERATNESSVATELVAEVTAGLTGADLRRIADDARRKRVLGPDLLMPQCLALSAIDVLRRETGRIADVETRLTRLALYLRSASNYSYTQLEKLCGVPRSTLHHRAKGDDVNARG